MGIVEDKINFYVDSIIKLSKYLPDNEKNSKKIAKLYTDYFLYCYENGISSYKPLNSKMSFGQLENLSYIIESEPEIFELDEKEVSEAWKHLLYVTKNGGGISEEEANLLLDWSVQKARVVLGNSCQYAGIKTASLTGACGYSQMLTLADFYRSGIKTTINNVSHFCENGYRHAFGTVTFPIEKDGKIEDKQYLIDATYRQFFPTIKCNEGNYYSVEYPGQVGPEAGYYMINYFQGREIATEILKKGHIELTPEVLKKYASSFIAEKLRSNNKEEILGILKKVDPLELKKILEEKQEEFDFDEEDIDEDLEKVGFPNLGYEIK